MKTTYCIICGKKKAGIPVEEDRVIYAIRWFKRNVTRNEQGNSLVVCKEDYATYKKNRDRFVSRRMIYVGIGVIFLVLGLLVSFSLGALAMGIIVIAALYLMSLLNYMPKLKYEETKAGVARKARQHNK